MTANHKDQICVLLKGIETGDPASVTVVNEAKYIQHNPQTHEGSEGLAVLFKRLAKTSPRVNIVRVFADGDYVFAHTEYDFASSNIGFEVFRFEDGQAVEHWDNIQSRKGPNESGHSMVDGPTRVVDLDLTESNRQLVKAFVDEVLVKAGRDQLERYVAADYIEHNPDLGDGLTVLQQALADPAKVYRQNHHLLAEGNFVLAANQGILGGVDHAFYDLFRIEAGKIVEHWDTIEAIPPRAEWNNDNGKF
ncbi:MAG: nuclear transport factor 2 family protein [Gammaproteobacteria bacterium]|nr:nuclear transport factor 2 family protein [Gammaproteobacteria bacterium]